MKVKLFFKIKLIIGYDETHSQGGGSKDYLIFYIKNYLPNQCIVYAVHDYKGCLSSFIGE